MREAQTITPLSPTRLKRENYRRTKHDPHFSKWQVLVGACDWEDYSLGKEGATKYRVHNLPISSGPGIYELGISSASQTSSGKLDPDDVVVVYLGQADNVRTRLQSYGRSGAHLGTKCLAGHCNELDLDCGHKGPALFEVIFKRGFSIVFRWAPMKDKRNAERTEAQLLDTFDYAWNKGANGSRRPDDILLKLDEVSSRTNRFPNIPKRLLHFGRGGVGIKIKTSRSVPSDKVTNPADENSTSFFSRIFKFGRTQPRLVSYKFGSNEELSHICGFIVNNGSPCKIPPVAGRKRCEEHKGRKMCRSIYTSHTEGNPNMDPSSSQIGQDHLSRKTCRVDLGDGTFCNRPAVAGRKRCEEHKGMKVNGYSNHKPKAEEKTNPSEIENCGENVSGTCGATLGNGSFCKRKPRQGNKRCWQHKGRKGENRLSGIDVSVSKCDTLKCGVALEDGSTCVREPVPGRKRCEQHKGMRVAAALII